MTRTSKQLTKFETTILDFMHKLNAQCKQMLLNY